MWKLCDEHGAAHTLQERYKSYYESSHTQHSTPWQTRFFQRKAYDFHSTQSLVVALARQGVACAFIALLFISISLAPMYISSAPTLRSRNSSTAPARQRGTTCRASPDAVARGAKVHQSSPILRSGCTSITSQWHAPGMQHLLVQRLTYHDAVSCPASSNPLHEQQCRSCSLASSCHPPAGAAAAGQASSEHRWRQLQAPASAWVLCCQPGGGVGRVPASGLPCRRNWRLNQGRPA